MAGKEMRIQFDRAKWSQDNEGFWLSLKVNIPHEARLFVETIQDKLYDAELKIHRERRSLEANSYLWILCEKIAETVRDITKEDVYREAVKCAGKFDFVLIADEAAETFLHNWNNRGLGWIAERTDYQRNEFTQIICYYGSSVYDTKSMSVLLEYIVDQAKELDIETRTPDEIAKMEALWEGK
jgi:hypothetical protein